MFFCQKRILLIAIVALGVYSKTPFLLSMIDVQEQPQQQGKEQDLDKSFELSEDEGEDNKNNKKLNNYIIQNYCFSIYKEPVLPEGCTKICEDGSSITYHHILGFNQKKDEQSRYLCCIFSYIHTLIAYSLVLQGLGRENIEKQIQSNFMQILQDKNKIKKIYEVIGDIYKTNFLNSATTHQERLKIMYNNQDINSIFLSQINEQLKTELYKNILCYDVLPPDAVEYLNSLDQSTNSLDQSTNSPDQSTIDQIKQQVSRLQNEKIKTLHAIISINGHYLAIVITCNKNRKQNNGNDYDVFIINSARYRWKENKGRIYLSTGFYNSMFTMNQDIKLIEFLVKERILGIQSKDIEQNEQIIFQEVEDYVKQKDFSILDFVQVLTKKYIILINHGKYFQEALRFALICANSEDATISINALKIFECLFDQKQYFFEALKCVDVGINSDNENIVKTSQELLEALFKKNKELIQKDDGFIPPVGFIEKGLLSSNYSIISNIKDLLRLSLQKLKELVQQGKCFQDALEYYQSCINFDDEFVSKLAENLLDKLIEHENGCRELMVYFKEGIKSQNRKVKKKVYGLLLILLKKYEKLTMEGKHFAGAIACLNECITIEDYEVKTAAEKLLKILITKGQGLKEALGYVKNNVVKEDAKDLLVLLIEKYIELVSKGEFFEGAIALLNEGITSEYYWVKERAKKLLKILITQGQGLKGALRYVKNNVVEEYFAKEITGMVVEKYTELVSEGKCVEEAIACLNECIVSNDYLVSRIKIPKLFEALVVRGQVLKAAFIYIKNNIEKRQYNKENIEKLFVGLIEKYKELVLKSESLEDAIACAQVGVKNKYNRIVVERAQELLLLIVANGHWLNEALIYVYNNNNNTSKKLLKLLTEEQIALLTKEQYINEILDRAKKGVDNKKNKPILLSIKLINHILNQCITFVKESNVNLLDQEKLMFYLNIISELRELYYKLMYYKSDVDTDVDSDDDECSYDKIKENKEILVGIIYKLGKVLIDKYLSIIKDLGQAKIEQGVNNQFTLIIETTRKKIFPLKQIKKMYGDDFEEYIKPYWEKVIH